MGLAQVVKLLLLALRPTPTRVMMMMMMMMMIRIMMEMIGGHLLTCGSHRGVSLY